MKTIKQDDRNWNLQIRPDTKEQGCQCVEIAEIHQDSDNHQPPHIYIGVESIDAVIEQLSKAKQQFKMDNLDIKHTLKVNTHLTLLMVLEDTGYYNLYYSNGVEYPISILGKKSKDFKTECELMDAVERYFNIVGQL